MTVLISATYKKHKELAIEIIELLSNKKQIDIEISYVLELICCELIKSDEQLASKLHIAMANTTNALLQDKQKRIDLGMNTIPFAYSTKQLSKLKPEARISYMLDICDCALPNGKLEGYSELSKRIYLDTISCLKEIIKTNNITSLDQLFEDHWYFTKANYIKKLADNNNLFDI